MMSDHVEPDSSEDRSEDRFEDRSSSSISIIDCYAPAFSEETISALLSELVFDDPVQLSNGVFFIEMKRRESGPVLLQIPRCKTKHGFVKTQKKMYCDFMIDTHPAPDNAAAAAAAAKKCLFFELVENIEAHAQEMIFANREQWFEHSLEKHEIENSFTPILKNHFRDGKNVHLLRSSVPTHFGSARAAIKIFDELERVVDPDTLPWNDTNLVGVIQFNGIKCSSRSFFMDIDVKQIMIVAQPTLLLHQKCVLAPTPAPSSSSSSRIVSSAPPQDNPQDNNNNHDEEVARHEREHEQREHELVLVSTDDLVLRDRDRREDAGEQSPLKLKSKQDLHRMMYRTAKEKAKKARDAALITYLELSRIKNAYHIEHISGNEDTDSDVEEFEIIRDRTYKFKDKDKDTHKHKDNNAKHTTKR